MQAAGKGGRIIAKINGLLEPAIVQALYRASQAGVQHRPDLPGHLCAAAGSAGRQRQHPRRLDRGSLSGAQPESSTSATAAIRRSTSARPTGWTAT